MPAWCCSSAFCSPCCKSNNKDKNEDEPISTQPLVKNDQPTSYGSIRDDKKSITRVESIPEEGAAAGNKEDHEEKSSPPRDTPVNQDNKDAEITSQPIVIEGGNEGDTTNNDAKKEEENRDNDDAKLEETEQNDAETVYPAVTPESSLISRFEDDPKA